MEYRFFENWLGDGLLISTGRKWLSRRRIITPAFHFKILDDFVPVFDKNSTILVDLIGNTKMGEPLDVYPFVTLAALDVICGKYFFHGLLSFAKGNSNLPLQRPQWDLQSTLKSIQIRIMCKRLKSKNNQSIGNFLLTLFPTF